MTKMIVDIMVEVLTILGIATKEAKRGRFSESTLCRFTIFELIDSPFRKVFEEVIRGHRDRGQPAEIGSIDSRGVADGGCGVAKGHSRCRC